MNNESVVENQTQPTSGSPSPGASSKIEIASDEDWKNRVKAEDAALDQQFRSEPAGGGTEPAARTAETSQSAESTTHVPHVESRHERPQPAREMPPATFADLVGLLSAQAMVALGLIPNPSTRRAEIQLPTARYFIDMLSTLEEKTAGQLTKEESGMLEETLHSLRMSYMQCSKQSA
jgi:hypothetical protein